MTVNAGSNLTYVYLSVHVDIGNYLLYDKVLLIVRAAGLVLEQ